MAAKKSKKATRKVRGAVAPKRQKPSTPKRRKAATPKRRKAAAPKRPKAPAPKRSKASTPTKSKRSKARARPAGAPSRMQAHRRVPLGPTELDTIKLAYLFRDTTPAAIYRAMLDSAEHSNFTGDRAEIDARVGGVFRSFHGFISGKTVELVPDARIVQTWRTHHFPKNNPDSTLELTLTPVADGTRLEMRHIDVPKDQVGFLVDGWVKFYWGPLAKHLGKRASIRPPPL